MNHSLRMLGGCILPIILIFLLPLIGVDEGITLFIFVVLMFGCHLMMLGGHRRGKAPQDSPGDHDAND